MNKFIYRKPILSTLILNPLASTLTPSPNLNVLKSHVQTRYSDEIRKQVDTGKGVYEVDKDTRLSRMKPIYTRWIINLYDKLKNPVNRRTLSLIYCNLFLERLCKEYVRFFIVSEILYTAEKYEFALSLTKKLSEIPDFFFILVNNPKQPAHARNSFRNKIF